MIREAYCSYEVAKLLKEKGFPISEHSGIYTNKDNLCLTDVGMMSYLNKEDYIHFEDFFIPTITQQMAIAWLRTKHIIIVVQPEYFNADGTCSYWGVDIWVDDNYEKLQGDFPSYEQAVETALKYSLENLI